MQLRVLVSLAVGAVGLAVFAVLAARTPAEREPQARAEDAVHRPPQPYEDVQGEAVAGAVQRVLMPPPEPEIRLPPAQARRAAEDSFEAMMRTLEELADAGRRPPRARRDQLYRETNDVFSALSAELDPNDADDMQLLEDAHIRMKAMLGELGVRVPTRRPPTAGRVIE